MPMTAVVLAFLAAAGTGLVVTLAKPVAVRLLLLAWPGAVAVWRARRTGT